MLQPPTSVTWSATTGDAQLGANVTVRILDADGAQVTSGPLATSLITLTTADATNGLTGTTTVAASGGLATFTGVGVRRAGSGIRLVASGAGLPSALSDALTVAAIAPAAPTIVLLDSGPVVNWGAPSHDGGSDIAHYFVVASNSSATYSLTACTGEGGAAPTVPGTVSVYNQPVFYRLMKGPLSCGFSTPSGSTIRFRVFAVNAAGLVSPSSALTTNSL